jgi:hypothetical protein
VKASLTVIMFFSDLHFTVCSWQSSFNQSQAACSKLLTFNF